MPPDKSSNRLIRFDAWSLDTNSGELARDGEKIRLQEQPLQILQALLANPGQVVTREELVARLWPKGIVDFETGLNTAIRRLRAALREDADAPRFIETLPRRGYRFIGRIEEPHSAAPSTEAEHELQTLMLGSGESGAKRTDCLVIVHAPQQTDVGRRYALDRDITTIGRGLENDIVLASQSVSRRHTRIEFRDGKTWVVDEASTNGTFLNDDTKPTRNGPMVPGDVLRVGDRVFAYLAGPDVDTQHQELILRIAMTDNATGASSRKHLDILLQEEIARAQRHNRPLSMLMIGVDHAREQNTGFGELINEATLRTFSTTLHKRLRPEDRLARYGDREFCVVMPETTMSGALKMVDELQGLLGTASGITTKVVVTAGAVTLQDGMKLPDMYRSAEDALTDARRRQPR